MTKKIELQIIEDFTYPLYYEDEFIQDINYNTFLQLRVDIRKLNDRLDQKPSGYYLLIKERKVHILKNGRVSCIDELGFFSEVPKNNFEFQVNCMFELF
jgi:hypothetical protein